MLKKGVPRTQAPLQLPKNCPEILQPGPNLETTPSPGSQLVRACGDEAAGALNSKQEEPTGFTPQDKALLDISSNPWSQLTG